MNKELFNYFLNIGTIYTLVGMAVTMILYFYYKKDFFGSFWLVLAMGIVGSFLGAIIEYLFKDVIIFMTKISGNINIFPPILITWIVIRTYHKVSSRNNKD